MKKNILLLHGALGAASQFEPLHALFERNFAVTNFDFEGHGAAPFADRPFRIESFADQLEEMIESRFSAPVDIFGYSMGGYVALYLASQRPGLIGRIFTLATKFAWSPESAAHETKFLDPVKMQEKVPQYAAELSARHGAERWQELVHRTKDMMLALGSAAILDAERFAAIGQPVRVAVGDRDQMVSLAETVEVYKALPQAQLEVMPDTRHPLEKVAPERLVRSAEDFFL